MGKLFILSILLSIIFLSSSLHFNLREDHKSSIYRPNHNPAYFGRYQRNHKQQVLVTQVIESNRDFIEQFNEKNKKLIEQSKDADGHATGGHSYIVGQNKFIEFTGDEVERSFFGAKVRQPSPESTTEINQDQHAIKSHHLENQMMRRHLLGINGSEDSHNLQEMQERSNHEMSFEEIFNHNLHLEDWSFEDPFEIDDHDLDDLYGDNVNGDDNWGWDWKDFDQDYYNDFSDDDPEHYFDDWQDEHWGYDDNGGQNDDWWGDDWDKAEQENQDNDDWWSDDNDDNDDWWSDDNDDKKTDPQPQPPGGKTDPYPSNAVQVDWNKKGVTSHIKDQGVCGSCWTFAAIGLVQSYFMMKGQSVLDLSEQNLVDCVRGGQSQGCQGGLVDEGLKYVKSNGVVVQKVYPYKGKDQNCAHNSGTHKIVKPEELFPIPSYQKLQQLVRKGPVAVAIRVQPEKTFMAYKAGIYTSCMGGRNEHAVIVVGFTKDYWIIRNSWGADWGEKGHMRMKRSTSKSNDCAILTSADYISQ